MQCSCSVARRLSQICRSARLQCSREDRRLARRPLQAATTALVPQLLRPIGQSAPREDLSEQHRSRQQRPCPSAYRLRRGSRPTWRSLFAQSRQPGEPSLPSPSIKASGRQRHQGSQSRMPILQQCCGLWRRLGVVLPKPMYNEQGPVLRAPQLATMPARPPKSKPAAYVRACTSGCQVAVLVRGPAVLALPGEGASACVPLSLRCCSYVSLRPRIISTTIAHVRERVAMYVPRLPLHSISILMLWRSPQLRVLSHWPCGKLRERCQCISSFTSPA